EEVLQHTPGWVIERMDNLPGNAIVSIAGEAEPELLADLDQERVGKARSIEAMKRALKAQNARQVNWTIAALPNAGWAGQVFGEPDVERLWDAIAMTVRLDDPD